MSKCSWTHTKAKPFENIGIDYNTGMIISIICFQPYTKKEEIL